MSRRGNCHDNTCAESFFVLLKRERIRRRIYKSKEQRAKRKVKEIYLIILSCFIIQLDVMEIRVTCRQWRMKRTIFLNNLMSRKLEAIKRLLLYEIFIELYRLFKRYYKKIKKYFCLKVRVTKHITLMKKEE